MSIFCLFDGVQMLRCFQVGASRFYPQQDVLEMALGRLQALYAVGV